MLGPELNQVQVEGFPMLAPEGRQKGKETARVRNSWVEHQPEMVEHPEYSQP
jgi:hypothetical protein